MSCQLLFSLEIYSTRSPLTVLYCAALSHTPVNSRLLQLTFVSLCSQEDFISRKEPPAANFTRVQPRKVQQASGAAADAAGGPDHTQPSMPDSKRQGAEECEEDEGSSGHKDDASNDTIGLPSGIIGMVQERIMPVGKPPQPAPSETSGTARPFPVAMHRSKSKVDRYLPLLSDSLSRSAIDGSHGAWSS